MGTLNPPFGTLIPNTLTICTYPVGGGLEPLGPFFSPLGAHQTLKRLGQNTDRPIKSLAA